MKKLLSVSLCLLFAASLTAQTGRLELLLLETVSPGNE